MKDPNAKIRSVLYSLLQPVVGVPVYRQYIPANIAQDAYVLITTINNNDIGTMHSFDTDSAVQIGIYTKDTQANSGEMCDDIAQIIYDTIFTTPQATIDLSPDFQNTVLKRANDISPDPILTGNSVFINRFITLRVQTFNLS